ncbi:MAG: hypothetical protein MJ200_05645 [Mycoplasmoidaceae bacterium]|nr:hypothetical protein [Mycoplasmoidaceae bacterium]
MKRKFILLPITLTALAPAISLVGCGGDEPEPTPPEDIVDLEFTEKVGDLNYPGFAFNNFNIEQGEQY